MPRRFPDRLRSIRSKHFLTVPAGMALCLFLAAAVLAPRPAVAQFSLEGATDLLNRAIGNDNEGGDSNSLTESEVIAGLREALRVGAETVTADLGMTDGFNADPAVHIPLPENLRRVQEMLSGIGMGSLGDEVELKMNRAAEEAMDQSREVLVNAVQAMTVEDGYGILNGPDDAATQYLQRISGDDIRQRIRPIVERTLNEVGAVAAVDSMLGEYQNIPFVPNVSADLTDHATDHAYDGLFHYIAQEEAAIRSDPAARTTDLLRRVFSE
ncbi:MAG: DUF4197 domain-containing protein [Alphaproteobacteria bacterium]